MTTDVSIETVLWPWDATVLTRPRPSTFPGIVAEELKRLSVEWWLCQLLPSEFRDLPDTQIRMYVVRRGRQGRLPADRVLGMHERKPSEIADVLIQYRRGRQRGKRLSTTATEEERVLLRTRDSFRCWICGYPFDETNVERFLDGQPQSPTASALFVDRYLPAGRVVRDRNIEIDHQHPATLGGKGGGNLQLICRFCNATKSDSLAGLDGMMSPVWPATQDDVLPRHLALRLMFLSSECFVCRAGPQEEQLLISAARAQPERHLLTPQEVQVVCADHDPEFASRWVPTAGVSS